VSTSASVPASVPTSAPTSVPTSASSAPTSAPASASAPASSASAPTYAPTSVPTSVPSFPSRSVLATPLEPNQPKGIINEGNTCHFNSLLQLLFSIDSFKDYILSDKNTITANDIRKKKEYDIIKENIKEVFLQLQDSENTDTPINIANQIENIQTCIHTGLILKDQQDPSEIMRNIIFLILENGDGRFLEKLNSNICLKTTFKCDESIENGPNNPEYILQIQLDNYVNSDDQKIELQKLINKNQQWENISDFKRDDKTCEQKKLSIKIPSETKYIILQLIRYKYENSESIKLFNEVTSPENLVIDDKKCIIKGCIMHEGKHVNTGHYKYIAYDENGKIKHCIDDNNITQENDNNVNINSYIYLYEIKKNYNNIRNVTVTIIVGDTILTCSRGVKDGKDVKVEDINYDKPFGPGGAIDKGESPENAAIRETKEESGLDIKEEQLEFFSDFDKRRNYIVRLNKLPDKFTIDDEHKWETQELKEILGVETNENQGSNRWALVPIDTIIALGDDQGPFVAMIKEMNKKNAFK
jgi:ADP-ribose pyrophosphatase YjhB (NUDIX family)